MALGYNYNIERTFFPNNQGIPAQGGAMQQQSPQSIGGILPPPPDEIQQVSNLTRQYYDKWFQINNFAKAMQSNYGIDVTNPDFNNPTSMQANDIFMQGVADLYDQGNALKRGKTFENIYATMDAQSPDVTYTPQEGQIATQGSLRDRRNTDRVTRGQDIAKDYFSEEEAIAKQQELDTIEQSIRSEIDQVVGSGDINAILNLQQELQQIKDLKATYNPQKDEQLRIADMNARNRRDGADRNVKRTDRPTRIADARFLSLENLRKRNSSSGKQVFDEVEYNPYTGEIVFAKEGNQTRYNSADDPEGTIFNRYLNMGNDSDVSDDVLSGNDPTRQPIPDPLGGVKQELDKVYREQFFIPVYDEMIGQLLSDPKNLEKPIFKDAFQNKSNSTFTAPKGLTVGKRKGDDAFQTAGGEKITSIEFDDGTALGRVFGTAPKDIVVSIKDEVDGGTRYLRLPLDDDNRMESLQIMSQILRHNANSFFSKGKIPKWAKELGINTGDIPLTESSKELWMRQTIDELLAEQE